MDYQVISFYRYTPINNPPHLVETLRIQCNDLSILGRILVAEEGINGAVSGTNTAITQFQKFLQRHFPKLTFRKQECQHQSYHKLVCKTRKEICVFGQDVDFKNIGTPLPPETLKQWYEQNEDFVIVDARNKYEYDVGHFQNALELPIQNFREFAAVAPKVLQEKKDKKIVLYCTGGVRCEKASAYLKQQGFPQVYQVEGGIINYANQVGDDKWQGGLFVFDDRLIFDVGEPITFCTHCSHEEEQMYNCHNLDCDTLFVCCQNCAAAFGKTCSLECKSSIRKRKVLPAVQKMVGVVENYYPKAGVALVRVDKKITTNITLTISGKTTHLITNITEMRDEQGQPITEAENQIITFPIAEKVRKNDKILIS